MARFRLWLRDHVLNRLRDPAIKERNQRRMTWRKSIVISAPVPIGSIDFNVEPPPYAFPTSLSLQDLTEPHPFSHPRRMSADYDTPQTISMIIEADEPLDDDVRPHTPPPLILPGTASLYSEPDALSADIPAPTRRPTTRNFSRRFSHRFSTFSVHSVSSYASSETKRMSQMSAVSALSKSEGGRGEDWVEGDRLSRRWSRRMSGALESYQTHTRNFAPLNVIG